MKKKINKTEWFLIAIISAALLFFIGKGLFFSSPQPAINSTKERKKFEDGLAKVVKIFTDNKSEILNILSLKKQSNEVQEEEEKSKIQKKIKTETDSLTDKLFEEIKKIDEIYSTIGKISIRDIYTALENSESGFSNSFKSLVKNLNRSELELISYWLDEENIKLEETGLKFFEDRNISDDDSLSILRSQFSKLIKAKSELSGLLDFLKNKK